MEQLHHPEHEADSRRRLANPEDKHPLSERGLELRELLVHTCKADLHLRSQLDSEPVDLCFQLDTEPVDLCVQLDNALLEFGIEPPVVQLVELAQLRTVGRIHHVEPVHELVGNVVPKSFVKLADSLAVTGTRAPTGRCRYIIRYARRTSVSINSGRDRFTRREGPERNATRHHS